MMNILHLNAGNESGGGLTHIIALMKILSEKGHQTELVVFEDGPVAKAARENCLKVTVLAQKSRFDFSPLKKLQLIIENNKIDIVHTHGPRANFMYSKISQKMKAKWVVTVHSDPTLDFMGNCFKGVLLGWLNLKSLRHADHFLTVTARFIPILKNKVGIDTKKISVARNGLSFLDNIPDKIKHDKFNVITVGRLHPVKNHILLMDAFLRADLPMSELTIVGDGVLFDEMHEWIKSHNAEKKIRLVGFKTQDEINQMYQRMDLAILSSQSESFPLVLLEAINQGVPIISTDVGDVEAMFPINKEYLVQPNQVEALETAIVQAYEANKNGQLVKQMGIQRAYMVNNFSEEKFYESVYNGYISAQE